MASEEITHDQTIPFHIWDDVPYARAICLNVTLRFDESDVIDRESQRIGIEDSAMFNRKYTQLLLHLLHPCIS